MSKVVKVKLWGRLIGFLGYSSEEDQIATFEYDDEFLKMGVSPSPLKLPVNSPLHTFQDISFRTFHGLPGFIADSLPDKFGNRLIDEYFSRKGVPPGEITALDRLLYVGNRAMGALAYEPSEEFKGGNSSSALNIELLAELAEEILNKKNEFGQKLLHEKDEQNSLDLLKIGSSAGGARSKVLVARDKDGKFYDGTIQHSKNYRYYLLKFDSLNNSDREDQDPKGMTKVEYIYSLIAKDCGIDMPNTDYVIDKNGDFHFLIERFDRVQKEDSHKIDKLHYVSWSGMAHANIDTAGSYSYEQLVLAARELGLGQESITEIFKRAIFNIVGRNQDDHTKNFGFLMDKNAEWRLSPAFDMTYSYDSTGSWTKNHQIRLNSKQNGFTMEDILSFGRYCNLNNKKSKEMLDHTVSCFSQFGKLAEKYEVEDGLKERILSVLRLKNYFKEL